jgi:hypothetical protein
MPEPLPAQVDAAVRAVAGQLGFAADDARPLRMHDAITLLLPVDHVVVRLVPDTGDAQVRASRAVRLTAWLATKDFPTIRPLATTPIEVDTYVATVWHELPATAPGTPVEVNTALGRLLRELHAHPGNLVADPSSRHGYALTDWEGACIGPRELDVVLVGAPGSRFGDPEHERLAFTAGYGYDIAGWRSFQDLRDIRDMHSLAAYIRASPSKPATAFELHRRISSLRDDDRTIQWAAV